jgi:hypothetical protein
MSSARPRRNAYIWVTWIAPLLANTNSCMWAAWFKAHFTYQKLSSFDDATWQQEHDSMVGSSRDALGADDFHITEEEENKFCLTSGTITLAGKPDLVATRSGRAIVVDCKSGMRHAEHLAQVMIYMAVLPFVRLDLSNRPIEGLLQYRDGELLIPAEAVNPDFRARLRSTIHLVGGADAPSRAPSIQECRFCPIGAQDCSNRVESVDIAPITQHDVF